MSTKKPVAKKPVAKAAAKPVAKKVAPVTPKSEIVKTELKDPPKPKVKEPLKSNVGMVLYTIRLSPTIVDQLHARGKKAGITHAEVARTALTQYFAKAA